MSERALILSADAWSMPDEKTGVVNSGISVWYVNDYREDTPQNQGFKPTKVSATAEILSQLNNKLPAIVDLDFGSRPGAGGKAALTLVKISLIKPTVDLFAAKQAVPA